VDVKLVTVPEVLELRFIYRSQWNCEFVRAAATLSQARFTPVSAKHSIAIFC